MDEFQKAQEIAAKYGIHNALSSSNQTSTTFADKYRQAFSKTEAQSQQPENRNVVQKVAGTFLDPVAKLGTEFGQFLGKEYIKGQISKAEKNGDTAKAEQLKAGLQKALNTNAGNVPGLGTSTITPSQVTGKDVAGQLIQTAATFVPGASAGSGVLAKTGVGLATGYGMDVGAKLQDKSLSTGEQFTPGIGTAIGGAIPLAGGLYKTLTEKAPSWFLKSALPKLSDNMPTDEALAKFKVGSVGKNLAKSKEAVSSLGNQIDSILSHPEYAGIKIGNPTVLAGETMTSNAGIIANTLSKFPNSNYTAEKISNAIHGLIPEQGKLVDKVLNGKATLMEANAVKKALYERVRKVFTDDALQSSNKQIGAAFSTAIADTIKQFVPESETVFAKLTKEIDWRNALLNASKKANNKANIGLYDVIGYAAGGLPAVAGEKIIRSGGGQLTVAKGLNALSKTTNKPAVRKAGSVIKKGVMSAVTNRQGQ